MTAKEQARDLHTKHYDVLTSSFGHSDMSNEVAEALYYGDAINHALITVREIIKNDPKYPVLKSKFPHDNLPKYFDIEGKWAYLNQKKYWIEVEKELKQLD